MKSPREREKINTRKKCDLRMGANEGSFIDGRFWSIRVVSIERKNE